MPPASRAIRKAREALASEGIRRPSVPVERIAQKYAVVVREPMPNDISGMLVPLPSSTRESQWAIVVNAIHPPVRQRFTIAHELGHIILHRYTTPHADGRFRIHFRDGESSKGRVKEEIEANEFAAELLMPEELVRQLAAKLNFDFADDAADAEAVRRVSQLAKRFEVSMQALSFRLANLSAVSS